MTTHRLTEDAKGVYVISATPFTDDGALDLASAERLVDFYVAEGVHGITFLGVMGEAPKLSDSKQVTFVRRVMADLDGRLPAIVGVSNPGIDNLVRLSEVSMTAGAAGVMIAGIPGLRTDDGLDRGDRVIGAGDGERDRGIDDRDPLAPRQVLGGLPDGVVGVVGEHDLVALAQ